MPSEHETNETEAQRGRSLATQPSSAFAWCSARCDVWRHKGCCYHPTCRRRRSRACRWMNYLTGVIISSQLRADDNFSGKTCPFPGSLPHGNWTCETQEIPIHGTSFLDEDAQSYQGIEDTFGQFKSDNEFPPLTKPSSWNLVIS